MPPVTGFTTANNVITDTNDQLTEGGPDKIQETGGGANPNGTGGSNQSNDGGDRNRDDNDGADGDGLRIHKWEPNVFSLASTRPEAELSGFEYIDASVVSGTGCGKQTCVIKPRADGEVGACNCPVPEEANVRLNHLCQCDEQLKDRYSACQFSAGDPALFPQKKLLVLGVGVVAGEDIPEGSAVAICKGRVSPLTTNTN